MSFGHKTAQTICESELFPSTNTNIKDAETRAASKRSTTTSEFLLDKDIIINPNDLHPNQCELFSLQDETNANEKDPKRQKLNNKDSESSSE
jgi:hypothetical protein